jgi:hypothetical protein
MKGCCVTGAGQAYETPNRDKLHGRIYRIVYDSARAGTALRLDNAAPQQLVRALSHDNMFWRLTAQRLLVERKRPDVVPALVQLVNTHTVDSLGLNPAALHGLWTLHGLGALIANSEAMRAARRALHHPAASLRRAALQLLPRDSALVNEAFDAGILPDRTSPTTVEYTVPISTLQDADAHVRLEALLMLAEAPPLARAAKALADMLAHPENARDPWIPDAIAMATVQQGGAVLLFDIFERRMPTSDSLAMLGIARAVNKIARIYAAREDASAMVTVVEAVPRAAPNVAVAALDGIAQGWPEEKPPQFTVAQRNQLLAATHAASTGGPVTDALGRVAARWKLPDIFRGQ